MLFLVGLGLGDERDITVKGLETVRSCDHLFLEHYTSVLGVSKERLEEYYGKEVRVAWRETVEQEADLLLKPAKEGKRVALLVVGDPLGATTHCDLYLRARQMGIPVQVIHNASIMNAVGIAGLQLYAYGPTLSIPFFTERWQPTSFYHRLVENRIRGQHTLCLLDIKVREQSEENLFKGRLVYEPPRFMLASEAAQQILTCCSLEGKQRDDAGEDVEGNVKQWVAVALSRVGHGEQRITVASLAEMAQLGEKDLGAPLHSLVIPSPELHDLEREMLRSYLHPTSTLKI